MIDETNDSQVVPITVWWVKYGVELTHMIRKDRFAVDGVVPSAADQFDALAGLVRPA